MGYLPHTSFDWKRPERPQTIHKKLSYEKAQQYVKQLEEAWIVAHMNLEKAQKSMEQQVNKHRQEPNFTVGNMIWVTTKN